MGYRLGKNSLKELRGVEGELVDLVSRAITLTKQDFTVYDGLRTEAEQKQMVKRGASRTMRSKHRVGRAVDLVPWINGQARWEWGAIYPIALAMAQAAKEVDLLHRLTWGGVWDKPMSGYETGSIKALKKAVEEYTARHPGPDFIDGPHFEISV